MITGYKRMIITGYKLRRMITGVYKRRIRRTRYLQE